tara:strand:+ start:644 stop:1327 length:684 start_codon:yes stop_codon:yes gene_type:complete
MKFNLTKVNNGKYDVFVIDNDEYIGPCIARGYEWDGWMREDIQKCHKPNTEIIDVGANIGYNTLMFSDYGPVVSFEPIFHEIVTLNVKNNSLKYPVQVIPCALSDENSISKIRIPSHGCQSNTLINYGGTGFYHDDNLKGEGVNVYCKRLDEIYTGIPSIIKIDVEGHELHVLKGATDTIKKHKPALLIEIHGFSQNNEVHTYIKSLGYGDPKPRPEMVYLYEFTKL